MLYIIIAPNIRPRYLIVYPNELQVIKLNMRSLIAGCVQGTQRTAKIIILINKLLVGTRVCPINLMFT